MADVTADPVPTTSSCCAPVTQAEADGATVSRRRVFAEAVRVLRPGGRFAVSDVIADPDMDAATRADMAAWTGCIAGALTGEEFRRGLEEAGLEDVGVVETHRVHEHAASAIVRARKPAVAD